METLNRKRKLAHVSQEDLLEKERQEMLRDSEQTKAKRCPHFPVQQKSEKCKVHVAVVKDDGFGLGVRDSEVGV